jgi:hypothetical protein
MHTLVGLDETKPSRFDKNARVLQVEGPLS